MAARSVSRSIVFGLLVSRWLGEYSIEYIAFTPCFSRLGLITVM
jgi:hypothetical protein